MKLEMSDRSILVLARECNERIQEAIVFSKLLTKFMDKIGSLESDYQSVTAYPRRMNLQIMCSGMEAARNAVKELEKKLKVSGNEEHNWVTITWKSINIQVVGYQNTAG